jgi:hypothetical protein
MNRRGFLVAMLVLALAACQQAPPPAEKASPAPSPSVAPPAKVEAPPARRAIALPSLEFPPGPLYVCQTSSGRSDIEYEARVESLCRRHPEMGPCQYERNACRAKGGRVFTQRGEEVTQAVEAEYDRLVMRVRFQGDSGSAPRKK